MKTVYLGQTVKDTITSLIGTAVARTEWVHGCVRITIQPKVDKDGKVPDSYTCDEPQVVIIDTEQPNVPEPEKRTYGDRPAIGAKPGPVR